MGTPMNENAMQMVDPPGEVIKEEIEARGWSQRDLSYILGVKEQIVSQMLSGARPISSEMARMLGDAFDVSADFFANLQKQYDLSRAKAPDPAVKTRATLQMQWPVREMIRRGWIENSDSALLLLQIDRFFEKDSADGGRGFGYAAKRTSYDDEPPAQVAWLFRVRQLARQMIVEAYSEQKLREALRVLKTLMIEPEEVAQVPGILAACGVRLVVVESLTNGKIDGVCTWLDDLSPVIGISTLHDRLDNFWFVLRHEIEHVLNGDGKEKAIFDNLEGEAATVSENIAKEERQANAAAAEFCVPQDRLQSFYTRKFPYFSERDVIGFASLVEVHPAMVIGQIQYRTGKYAFLRRYQVPVRQYVTAVAVTDGWGQVQNVTL